MRIASIMRRQGLARRRAFDLEEAVRAASRVFHELGYAGCSLADLERATGVSRMSLYNAIGDKESIFLTVLEAFSRDLVEQISAALREETLDSLIALFAGFTNPERPTLRANGLLVLTAALERETQSQRIRKHLATCRGRVVAIIQRVLEAESARGALSPEVSPVAAAEFLVTTYWGFAATARVYDDISAMAPPMGILTRTMESWRARPDG